MAKFADRWAGKCQFRHPGHHDRGFEDMGQNLAAYTKFDVDHLVSMWINEKQLYNVTDRSCRGVCGHYTQVGLL